jgi:hypothetical protein
MGLERRQEMAEEREVPNQTFAMSKAEFLKITGGLDFLLPGYESVFRPDIEQMVIQHFAPKADALCRLMPDEKVCFDDVRVKKIGLEDNYAVVKFARGRVVKE